MEKTCLHDKVFVMVGSAQAHLPCNSQNGLQLQIIYFEKIALRKYIRMQFIMNNAVNSNSHQYLQISAPSITYVFFFWCYFNSARASPALVVDKSITFHQGTTAKRKVIAKTELTYKAYFSYLIVCQLQIAAGVNVSIFDCLSAAGRALQTGNHPRQNIAELHDVLHYFSRDWHLYSFIKLMQMVYFIHFCHYLIFSKRSFSLDQLLQKLNSLLNEHLLITFLLIWSNQPQLRVQYAQSLNEIRIIRILNIESLSFTHRKVQILADRTESCLLFSRQIDAFCVLIESCLKKRQFLSIYSATFIIYEIFGLFPGDYIVDLINKFLFCLSFNGQQCLMTLLYLTIIRIMFINGFNWSVLKSIFILIFKCYIIHHNFQSVNNFHLAKRVQ